MEEKRTGNIVAVVTLAIAAAFAAIMFLFLNQSISIAARYAERTTDLVASDLSSGLVAYVSEQAALVSSSLLDEELAQALADEGESTNPAVVARDLAPVLDRLEVDDNGSLSYTISAKTYTIYRSNGSWERLGSYAEDVSWVDAICRSRDQNERAPREAAATSTYRIRFMQTGDGIQSRILTGRLLADEEDVVGVVGVSVPGPSLASVMAEAFGDLASEQRAVCFSPEGVVLFSTDESVLMGQDVYEAFPQIEPLRATLPTDSTSHKQVWDGLEGLFPRSPELYEVRYCPDFDAYLLVTNTANTVFDAMRARSTTLLFALTVVMVLLMLLVIASVRWYRSRLIKVATTDELTGLANRKSFAASYEGLAQHGGEAGTLVLIDVDLFKHINDTYGHAAGDRALAAVASEVRALAGPNGLAGRWGGDEFIGVMRVTGHEAVERIHTMIERVRSTEFGEGFSVSISVGSTIIDWSSSLERMVEQADDALYQSKEGGRGFHTPYVVGVTPHISGDHVPLGVPVPAGDRHEEDVISLVGASTQKVEDPRSHRLLDLVVESFLEAVHKMIPFVAGGGILIAIAFLIDGASVDVNALSTEARANFGSITPIAAGLKDVGSAAFNFMLPIFAAFLARGLAGDEAFMAGFAGGYLSAQGSAGFAGAICAAAVAAVVVRMMCDFVEETPKSVQRIAPVLMYPVFSLLIMYLLMTFVIGPVASSFDAMLTSVLRSLEGGDRIVLGIACGAMMATDMGGPINKAAYHFGLAAITSGSPDIMAAVMVGGMVPPCGIALCMVLFRDRFVVPQRDQMAATLVMGLSFITEGAIPFVLTDFLRVIPACMLGSGVAGAFSMIFGCTLMAPHGGIFVFPVVGNAPMYLVALVIGSLETALLLGLLRQPVE